MVHDTHADIPEPYDYIAQRTQEAVGPAIVTVSKVDPVAWRLTVKSVRGLGNLRAILTTLIGSRVEGWQVDITESAREGLYRNRFVRIEDGIREALFRRFPPGMSRMAERLLNIQAIYGRGIVHQGHPIAAVLIALQKESELHAAEQLDAICDGLTARMASALDPTSSD